MIEFYFFPEYARALLITATVMLITAQTWAVMEVFRHYRRNAADYIENLREVFISFHILFVCLAFSGTVVNIAESLAAESGFVYFRYALFSAVFAVSAVLCVLRKTPINIISVFFCALTLPVTEKLAGRAFPWLFIFAVTFWILRAGYIYFSRSREIKNGLSRLSVKQAMDTLNMGLLFCSANGGVQLINLKMQKLMTELTGEIWRNGRSFREWLFAGEGFERPESTAFEGHMVYRLEDKTVWMFSENEMAFRGGRYFQIAAADITESWNLTSALAEREEQLRKKGLELESVLARIEIIRKDEELLRVKAKVHDIMSQRLAILMRILRAGKNMDESTLTAYAGNMLEDIKAESELSPSEGGLGLLRQTFDSLGVSVSVSGEPPSDPLHAAFFDDFAREGVANAVRHGFATEVEINCEDIPGGLKISIINNGFAPGDKINERGGINQIRRRLAELNGTLEIEPEPRFRLTALINTNLYSKNG